MIFIIVKNMSVQTAQIVGRYIPPTYLLAHTRYIESNIILLKARPWDDENAGIYYSILVPTYLLPTYLLVR